MNSVLQAFNSWSSPGPVASAFLADRKSLVRAILGPVGSGKTVTTIFDHLTNAAMMPVCRDGIIRYKLAMIGSTYGQLERNLYPTWNKWLPRKGGGWTPAEWGGGGGRFATHRIETMVPRDGKLVKLEFEAIFAAIGENKVEEFMRGFEPTAFGIYEVDQLPEEILHHAILRLGRYPSKDMLPPGVTYRRYVTADLNAPDVDSWFYKTFEENLPEDFKLYRQPSGRSPKAENRRNLPADYYEKMVSSLSRVTGGANLIKRMVDAKYAPSSYGQPVYPEYSDDLHLAKAPLKAIDGVPVRIGLDAGLRGPAAVLTQWLSIGQWRVFAELVPGRMGPKTFARMLRRLLSETAPQCQVLAPYADPFGFTGSDKESGLLSWAETMMNELELPILPAPTNEISVRLEAVRDELTRMVDGETPAFLLSPTCKVLRKGFVSHYRYPKQKVAGAETTGPVPVKDEFADPHDGLQYVLLGAKGRHGVIQGTARSPSAFAGAGNGVFANTWNPFA